MAVNFIYPEFDRARFKKMMKQFGLDEKRRIHTFSKGMKKQLSVIEAFRIDIPKQYADTLVPKLSLQPIIENAITHAFSNPGIICLSCTDTGEHFQIAVSDNGCGIPEQRLAQLRRSLDGTGEHSGSIGLQNVHRRLKLLFGPDCGLQIESQWGKGTTVYLNLPPVGGKA